MAPDTRHTTRAGYGTGDVDRVITVPYLRWLERIANTANERVAVCLDATEAGRSKRTKPEKPKRARGIPNPHRRPKHYDPHRA